MNSCQFYVVLGNGNYISRNNTRVCINIKDNELERYDEIKNRLFNIYAEKTREGFIVNNEIIFLIFDERYRNTALKIMNQIGLNGRVLVLNKENNSAVNMEKNVSSSVINMEGNINTNNVSNSAINMESNVNSDVVINNYNSSENNDVDESKFSKVAKPNFTYRPDTQVFHPSDFNGGSSTTKSGNGLVSNKSNVLSLKKPKKNNRAAFISFPVVIFILSTMLLIASFVLLFIMD